MGKYLKIAHLLSLDVVLGAFAHFLLIAKLGQNINDTTYFTGLSLSIAVWAIYILDRILDNLNPTQVQTERHIFYKTNYKKIILLLVILCFSGILSVCFLKKSTLYFGFIMCASMLFYWAMLRFLAPSKELTTAILYSFGIIGSAISIDNFNAVSNVQILAGISLFLSAYQNLYFLDNVERVLFYRIEQSQNSYLLKIYSLIFLNFVILLFGFYLSSNSTTFCSFIALSTNAAVQTWICFQPQTDKYRWLGECGFMLPILILFF